MDTLHDEITRLRSDNATLRAHIERGNVLADRFASDVVAVVAKRDAEIERLREALTLSEGYAGRLRHELEDVYRLSHRKPKPEYIPKSKGPRGPKKGR